VDPWQIVAVLAAALGTTWGTFIAAFFKGDLIPGHVYRREVNRGDTATTQNERNAKAIDTLTTAGKADSIIIRDLQVSQARLQATLLQQLDEIVKLKAKPDA
jgi:hypothetical protein